MKLRKIRRQLSHINGLLLQNPLLGMGCFLAMAVVPVVSLRTAVALALMLTVVSIPTYMIMSALGRRLKALWLVAVSPICASIFYIPAYYLVSLAFPAIDERFGFYLPILVMDIFFTARCPNLSARVRPSWMLLDVSACCLGLGLALSVVGVFRELLGSGTLWGQTVRFGDTFTALQLPFGGFIVLAVVMALGNLLARWVRHALRNAAEMEKLEDEHHD